MLKEEPKENPTKRVLPMAAIGGFLILLLTVGYFAYRRFLKDREKTLNYMGAPAFSRTIERNYPDGRREVRRYTAEELEKARKEGKLPPGVQSGLPAGRPATDPAAANDRAIQQSMRTLEEINRINEMNRRLIEQQQRLNRQR